MDLQWWNKLPLPFSSAEFQSVVFFSQKKKSCSLVHQGKSFCRVCMFSLHMHMFSSSSSHFLKTRMLGSLMTFKLTLGESVSVDSCLSYWSLCDLVMYWWPVQDVPKLFPNESLDMLQLSANLSRNRKLLNISCNISISAIFYLNCHWFILWILLWICFSL